MGPSTTWTPATPRSGISTSPAGAETGRIIGDPHNSLLSGVVYDPLDRCLYITDYELDEVLVVNSTTLVTEATIPVGVHPVGLVFDSENGWIEVTDSGSANLTGTERHTPGIGHGRGAVGAGAAGPRGIFFDPLNGETFVASPREGIVVALAPVPVLGEFTAAPGGTDVGIPIHLHALASGGTGTLRDHYSDLPPGCTSLNAPVIDCVPQAAGNYTVTVNVTDAAAGLVSAKVTFAVEPDPTVLIAPTPAAVDGLTAIGFDAVAANGTPPYRMAWAFGDGGTGPERSPHTPTRPRGRT